MKLLSFLLSLSVIVFSLSSCKNQKAESTLLTNKTSCSPEDCPEPQKKVDGSLSIGSDQGTYQLNVDKSDVIEIAGKCSDLGIRANRILVQVFEGENTSNAPYIDNESSVNCVNSKTNSGLYNLNNPPQRCFWLTQGRGVIDAGLEYPQCFNGRFSFSIKLGRILRLSDLDPGTAPTLNDTNNPRQKYLVRFKLRTSDGAISESAWNSATIDRGVTKPTFSLDPKPLDEYKCDIKVDAFRNLERLTDISYDILYTPEYINGSRGTEIYLNNASPISYTEPIPTATLPHVTNYRIPNLIPGVKYKVKVKAYDKKYSYSLPPSLRLTTEESTSEEKQCENYQASALNYTCLLDGSLGTGSIEVKNSCGDYYANTIYLPSCTNSLKTCNLEITGFPSISSPGQFEFMVVKGKLTWDPKYEPPVAPGPCAGQLAGATEGCIFTLPLSSVSREYRFRPEFYPKNTCTSATVNTLNGKYAIAVRYSRSATEKGAWSNMVTCEFKN